MEKRQMILGGVLGLLAIAAAGGYWWSTQQADNAPPAPAPAAAMQPATSGPAAIMATSGAASGSAASGMGSGTAGTTSPTAASGSLIAAKPPVSDAVALSEEELDKLKQERLDLDSRAQDLQSQVKDGKQLIALKEKQIAEAKAALKAAAKAGN